MQGCKRSKGKSKPEMGLQSLSQGRQIRAWNGEGWAVSRCGVPKMETKVCGGMGYAVEDFRTSLGHGDAWIGVPVRCYTECNTPPHRGPAPWHSAPPPLIPMPPPPLLVPLPPRPDTPAPMRPPPPPTRPSRWPLRPPLRPAVWLPLQPTAWPPWPPAPLALPWRFAHQGPHVPFLAPVQWAWWWLGGKE